MIINNIKVLKVMEVRLSDADIKAIINALTCQTNMMITNEHTNKCAELLRTFKTV